MSDTSNGIVVPVTAAQTLANRNCAVTSLALNPAAAACTVSLYDPLPGLTVVAGATLRYTLTAGANSSSSFSGMDSGIEFANGCIVVVTGVGATASIGWKML